MSVGYVCATERGAAVFPGALLFDMKDQHGLPLDFAIDAIITKGLRIDWAGMISRARACRWWDFQLYDAVSFAIDDAGLPRSVAAELKSDLRAAIMAVQPHPLERAA